MLNVKSWSAEWGGRTLTVEVGKFALQANGSCTVRYGDTMILATVVQSDEAREEIDYFPLAVDFQEKLYAAGKIKGSRFIKREGRPSDESVLVGRMVDRAIRPLFNDQARNDVHVVVTALSVDGQNDAAIPAFVGASVALAISPIVWDGPIACARIGKKDGNLILNATLSEAEEGILDLVVAGTPDRLVMVEAGAKEIPEAELIDAMKWGCSQLKPALDLVSKIQKEIGAQKNMTPVADDLKGIDDNVEEKIRQTTRQFVLEKAGEMMFDSVKVGRKERDEMVKKIKKAAAEYLTAQGFAEEAHQAGLNNVKEYAAEAAAKRILEKDQRLDGRALTDIRELNVEIDCIPRVHGSGMFMRGDTQVLSVVTLGAPGDVQTLDTMEEEGTKRYMHHYFDAPFTYGEAGFMRGPSRRAIGHGALAERALEPVLPSQEDFPYAIRVVSEILGSNGSSSMASACGSALSLMAAGVPIKKPVAGIAMGLASNENKWKVLTDLQDVEDGPGGMDFKIAGTRDGITAVQMDTKTKGLTWDIVETAVKQAREGLSQILDSMAKVISEPRAELSPYAPRIETIMIDPDKIRDVIGPGGKIINKIIDETGVQIDIEQDGRVMITSTDADGMRRAVKMVQDLTKEVEPGEIYEGTVVRLEDFGVFVQILPNKDGLVHVSEIAWQRINRPGDVLNLGDKVKVKVKEIDNLGRVNLSMRALLPRPDGFVEQSPRPPRGHHQGGSDRQGGGFLKRRP
ncbi:MAG: polyribonucleotide nucleotidyltransferase [Patescibacteria group bacterium]